MKQLSKRERTYAVIFGLALVFGVWNYRHLFFGPDDQAPGDTSPVASQAMLAPEQHASAVVRPAVARDSNFVAPSWSGDPFHRSWQGAMAVAQVTRAQAKPPPLTLSAIVVRPNARYAVINGKIVREGQRIGGRTVTLIEKARVVLDDQGVEVTLSL